MRKVIIEGKEYVMVYNLKGLFTYEEIAGKPYSGERTVDNYMLMYSVLLANNDDFSMGFDELISACDKDMSIYSEFVELMLEESKRIAAFRNDKKKAMNP